MPCDPRPVYQIPDQSFFNVRTTVHKVGKESYVSELLLLSTSISKAEAMNKESQSYLVRSIQHLLGMIIHVTLNAYTPDGYTVIHLLTYT